MTLEAIRKFEALDKIKEKWNELVFSSSHNSVFLTHEWFNCWWKCFSENRTLEILVLKDNNKLIGIAPLMIENEKVKFISNREVTDYCDFIILKGKEEIFFESIFDYLKKYSNIKLIYIREDSPTLKHLPEIASKYNFECKINVIEKSLYISPPLSYDDYLIGLNSKNRHELKRKLRKTQMLENLRIEKITSLNDLKHFINFFIDFHKKSSLQKYKFWKSNTYCFFNEICKEFALNNWIELYFLFHKDRIISALFCFSYSKKLYLYNSAFDKNYSQYNPGLYLFNHVIKEAIQKSIEEIDFLRGEERYKYDFGAKARKLYEVLIQRSKE